MQSASQADSVSDSNWYLTQCRKDWEFDLHLERHSTFPYDYLTNLTQHAITADDDWETQQNKYKQNQSTEKLTRVNTLTSSSSSSLPAPATAAAAVKVVATSSSCHSSSRKPVNDDIRSSLLGYWHSPPSPYTTSPDDCAQLCLREDGFSLQVIREMKNLPPELPAGICENEFNGGVSMKGVALSNRWEVLDTAGWQKLKKSQLDSGSIPRKKPSIAFHLLPFSGPQDLVPYVILRTLDYYSRRLRNGSYSELFWLRTIDDVLRMVDNDETNHMYLFAKQHLDKSGVDFYFRSQDGRDWFRGAAPNGGLVRHNLLPYIAVDATKVRDDILRKADKYEPPFSCR